VLLVTSLECSGSGLRSAAYILFHQASSRFCIGSVAPFFAAVLHGNGVTDLHGCASPTGTLKQVGRSHFDPQFVILPPSSLTST
jgi:hypothetical protein